MEIVYIKKELILLRKVTIH